MIQNLYGGRKEVTCDICGDGFEAEDFEEARAAMRQEGWKSKKVGEIWLNYCPDCAENTRGGPI